MKYASKPRADLKLVFHLSEQRAPEDGIDLVVLPGLWAQTTPGADSRSKQCMWLKLLVASTDQDVRVFIYSYDIDPKGGGHGLVWHQMLSLAPTFLDSLRQARPFESQRRPLYFICHSLSGILLKQAMYLADRDFPAIRNAVAGVILLGCPHLTSSTDPQWDLWKMILRVLQKDLPKNILQKEDIKLLSGVCERFTGLNLDVPVLSVYERSMSKIRDSGPLGRFRPIERVLVDRDHATCRISKEELFGVDANHEELNLMVHGSPLFEKLVSYLGAAPEAGPKVVTMAYQRQEPNIEPDTLSSIGEVLDPTQAAAIPATASIINLTIRPKRVLLPCHSLEHARNPAFFGQREVLGQIDEALLSSEQNLGSVPLNRIADAPDACAVYGIGGLGKTEIAIEYIHTRKESFDAVFWIHSASTTRLLAGFRNMAVMLGIQDETSVLQEEPEVTRDKVKAWLANPVRTLGSNDSTGEPLVRWLIVFDNADDPDLLYDFWPTGGSGCVLITSRDQIAATTSLSNLVGIELQPMENDDAARFLQSSSQRTPEADSEKTCQLIAGKLGGLPLAIVQMASLIKMKHLSLTEFVDYYDYDSKKFQESPIPGYTKQQTIAFIWNIESLSPSALALLRVLSMLDGDSIPEEILTKGAKKVELADYPSEKIAYFEAREALMKSSLVTRNKELTILRVHRLVQHVVRSKLSLHLFRDVFDAATLLQGAVWPFINNKNLNEVDRLRKVQRYQPQVSQLRSVLESRGVDSVKPTLLIASLFNESSWQYQLQETGYGFKVGDDYAVLAEQIAGISNDEPASEARTKVLADSYRFQGIIGSYLGTDKGVSCTKKWIELLVERIMKHQLKDDIETLPIAYNEYGRALMRIPDEKEALRSWELASDTIRERTKSGELPFPYPWFHRALIYSFDGHADLAETTILPILEERERKLGKDDTGTYETGMLLTCMGHVRRAQGKKDESYAFNKRAEAVVPVATGERSLASLTAYYRLTCDKYDREQFIDAQGLLEKIITFAGDEPWFKAITARANWKLGHTLLHQGGSDNEDEAKIILDRAMLVRRELVPDDDREEEDLSDDDWDGLVFYLFR